VLAQALRGSVLVKRMKACRYPTGLCVRGAPIGRDQVLRPHVPGGAGQLRRTRRSRRGRLAPLRRELQWGAVYTGWYVQTLLTTSMAVAGGGGGCGIAGTDVLTRHEEGMCKYGPSALPTHRTVPSSSALRVWR
jgi:hypothetical protein